MTNKRLVLIITLIAIAALLVSGGNVMAASGGRSGGHGGSGSHGGGHSGGHSGSGSHGGGHGGGHNGWHRDGHGWHGDGYWYSGWGWPYFGLGVAAGAILSYPYYSYPYYSYPYYAPYPYVPAYSPRVIYRERGSGYTDEYSEPARTRQSSGSTWYYCRQSNAYYPYVSRCSAGWEKVPALPPSSGPEDER